MKDSIKIGDVVGWTDTESMTYYESEVLFIGDKDITVCDIDGDPIDISFDFVENIYK